MVVIWHWVFTILELSAESVSPSNPIGFTRGMWAITWILQVMPIFFFVGGYTHRLAFDNYEKGTSRRFLKRRTKRLLVPALGLITSWVALGFILRRALDAAWTWPAVILVLSPLWFLVVYLVLVAIAPLAIRAHWRLLAVAGVVPMLVMTAREGRYVVLPLIGDDLGLGATAVGAIVTVGTAADLLLFPVAGWTMDRYGRLAAMLPSFGLIALGVLLVAAQSSVFGPLIYALF